MTSLVSLTSFTNHLNHMRIQYLRLNGRYLRSLLKKGELERCALTQTLEQQLPTKLQLELVKRAAILPLVSMFH